MSMRKERKIINTNIRLNLLDEADRQAWEYLHLRKIIQMSILYVPSILGQMQNIPTQCKCSSKC